MSPRDLQSVLAIAIGPNILGLNPIYPSLLPIVAYLKTDRGHIVPPLNILRLFGVRVPIIFGNHKPMNDCPYSKGFMKFGYLEP